MNECIICGGEPDKTVEEQVTGQGLEVAVCEDCNLKASLNSAYGRGDSEQVRKLMQEKFRRQSNV